MEPLPHDTRLAPNPRACAYRQGRCAQSRGLARDQAFTSRFRRWKAPTSSWCPHPSSPHPRWCPLSPWCSRRRARWGVAFGDVGRVRSQLGADPGEVLHAGGYRQFPAPWCEGDREDHAVGLEADGPEVLRHARSGFSSSEAANAVFQTATWTIGSPSRPSQLSPHPRRRSRRLARRPGRLPNALRLLAYHDGWTPRSGWVDRRDASDPLDTRPARCRRRLDARGT